MHMLQNRSTRRLLFAAAVMTAAAFVLRRALIALAVQLAAASLLMVLALPLCRVLEKRMPPGTAAALSLGALGIGSLLLLLGLIPPLVRQFRQLSELLPALIAWIGKSMEQAQQYLARHDIRITPVRDSLLEPLAQGLGSLMSAILAGLRSMASSVGKVLLSPLIAFYLLRDRRRIATWLTLAVPVNARVQAVRAMREMRREVAGFLRGQLTVSLAVGVATAAGLALVGTPAWLLFGLLMGVMELIPYFGPLIAGVPAVLVSLQSGLTTALWTLAVLFAVQQLEGTFLSPRLMSSATRLHPLAVLLIISSGGLLGGGWGMILSLPLTVALRGALHGARR